MKSMPWFRFYSASLNDPKIQTLPGESFKFWINLLSVANEQEPRGSLPSISEIAFHLRMPIDQATSIMEDLITRGLIDRTESGLMPHNWHSRQYDAKPELQPNRTSSTERVRRYRQRLRDRGETANSYTKHRETVFERDGNRCVYCGNGDKLVLDHLVPVLRGGDSEPDNLVAACKACNSGKSGRLIEETSYKFQDLSKIYQYHAVIARLFGANGIPSETVTGNSDSAECHGFTSAGGTVTGNRNTPPDTDTDTDSDSERDEIISRVREREDQPAISLPSLPDPENGPIEIFTGSHDPAREQVEQAYRLVHRLYGEAMANEYFQRQRWHSHAAWMYAIRRSHRSKPVLHSINYIERVAGNNPTGAPPESPSGPSERSPAPAPRMDPTEVRIPMTEAQRRRYARRPEPPRRETTEEDIQRFEARYGFKVPRSVGQAQ